jgi:hypothetical protein
MPDPAGEGRYPLAKGCYNGIGFVELTRHFVFVADNNKIYIPGKQKSQCDNDAKWERERRGGNRVD